MQEGVFDLPTGYVDATINTLVFRRPNGDLSLVVSRSPTQKKTLPALTTERLREQSRRLPHFELGRDEGRTLSGREARDITVRYFDGQQAVQQRSVSFLADGVLLVVVVSGPTRAEADIDSLFEKTLATLHVKETSG